MSFAAINKTDSLRRAEPVAAAILFLVSIVVYVFTAAPGIVFQDSGELAGAAHTLGVAHPPGFPLFVLLGRIAGALPFAGFAFRLNMASALLTACAVVLIFRAARAFAFRIEAAVAAALCVAFSRAFCSRGSSIDPAALNAIFAAASLALIAAFTVRRDFRAFAAAAFVILLSVQNYCLNAAVFLPVLIILIFSTRKFVFLSRLREIFLGAYLLALFASAYLFLPLRAAAAPAFNWNDPTNWFRFLANIRRLGMEEWDQRVVFNLDAFLKHAVDFFIALPAEFTIAAVFLILMGFLLLWGENRRRALLLTYLVLAQALCALYYLCYFHSIRPQPIAAALFTGAHIALVMFAAVVLDALIKNYPGKVLPAAVLALGVVLAVWQLGTNRSYNNFSHRIEAVSLARATYHVAKRDAVLLVSGKLHPGPTMYYRNVEGVRPDTDIIDDDGALNRAPLEAYAPEFSPMDTASIEERYVRDEFPRRPVYSAFRREFIFSCFGYRDLGPVFRLTDSNECALSIWRGRKLRSGAAEIIGMDYDTRQYYSFKELRRAGCLMLGGKAADADKLLTRLEVDQNKTPYIDLAIGDLYRQFHRDDLATAYYTSAAQNALNDTAVWMRLGAALLATGKETQARRYFEKARQNSPLLYEPAVRIAEMTGDPDEAARAMNVYNIIMIHEPHSSVLRVNMGNAFDVMGRPVEALAAYRAALRIDPDSTLARLNLALFYIHRGKPRAALVAIGPAVRRFPGSTLCRYVRGVAFQNSRLYNDAVMEYRKVIAIDPDFQAAWRGLVGALEAAERFKEAEQADEAFRTRMKSRIERAYP